MQKKTLLILKSFFIFCVWGYLGFTFLRELLIFFWKFDILLISDWVVIKKFWYQRGIIKKGEDIMLFLSIISAPFIWTYIFVKLMRFRLKTLITAPLLFHNNLILKKYNKTNKRTIIKNLYNNKDKNSIKDIIEERIKVEEKKEKERIFEADNIRTNIKNKLEKKKK